MGPKSHKCIRYLLIAIINDGTDGIDSNYNRIKLIDGINLIL